VFFANSGAEANECALKLARRFGGRGRHVVVSAFGSFHGRTLATLHATGQPAKHEVFQPLPEGFRHVVISAFGSFHGRTLATLHMTGQPQKHEAFQPLPEGFKHADWADVADLERMIDDTTAAVMLEPVQGEGGVNPAPPGYFADIRRLCDERNLLFMVDEVQTGLGRTGKWFGFQHFLDDDHRPDVVTMAKALGNGMPIGAAWATREVAAAMKPGDHATTFGGTPLASAAAVAVLDVMRREDIPAKSARAGARLTEALSGVAGVKEVRGLGMLLAVELEAGNAGPVQAKLMELGVVTNPVTGSALRLAPPQNITDDEIAEGVAIIAKAIAEVGAGS
jgi:acetylornithine/succinyldiaminopimelate/putrescine aminotransferase